MTTKPTLPASLTLSVLSRHIDFSDNKNPQFKFILELVNEGRRMSFDYSGGILAFIGDKLRTSAKSKTGWVNFYSGNWQNSSARKLILGQTQYATRENLNWLLPLCTVSIHDVVYSLLMDSDCLEYDFEDWAANFGYDEDSRKAEETYNLCRRQSKEFVRLIGQDKLEELKEAFQDY